jgi:hypothetical protein
MPVTSDHKPTSTSALMADINMLSPRPGTP